MAENLSEQILRNAGEIMSLSADAENRLIRQMDRLTDAFARMTEEFGKMSAHMEYITRTQEDGKEFGTRLTKLETKAEIDEQWKERAAVNNRWLIGLCIGTFVAVLAMALKVFGKG